ncbi:hypothetical protein [Sporosarcina sp. P21c]|uniref:hypothetical protein n=1 Tax=Sporosarcina sp. P21c TaxID=2048255 RepID=UPI0018EA5B0D|nr:hypothetical protein [Sporosarcina sp. P21c]
MKWIPKAFVSSIFVLLLTGCIGENYDYSPPVVSILSNPDLKTGELKAANVSWYSDKEYTKTTEDIYSLAREQKPLHYYSGQQMDVLFENQDFALKELSIYVSQYNKKTDLPVKDRFFELPKEEGEYVIVVKLLADSGRAEYVGNIVIEKKDDYPYYPTVSFVNIFDRTKEEKLEAMKGDWQLPKEMGEQTIENEDMSFFLKDQEKLHYDSGQRIEILFDHHNFKLKKLKVYVKQNGEIITLPVEGNTFDLPEKEGAYIIVVNLLSDKGHVEYVGNIVISE